MDKEMDQDATCEIPRPITEFNLLLITPLLHPCILCGINTLHSEVGGEGMVLLQGCTHTFSVVLKTLLTYSNYVSSS